MARLERLRSAVAGPEGSVRYALSFDRDAHGTEFVDVEALADVALVCQRSLETFTHPLDVRQRLGLIRREADEAGLPEGFEPLLVEGDTLNPLDVVEDELLLSLPLVPVRPDLQGTTAFFSTAGDAPEEPAEESRENPFAALGTLKREPPRTR